MPHAGLERWRSWRAQHHWRPQDPDLAIFQQRRRRLRQGLTTQVPLPWLGTRWRHPMVGIRTVSSRSTTVLLLVLAALAPRAARAQWIENDARSMFAAKGTQKGNLFGWLVTPA